MFYLAILVREGLCEVVKWGISGEDIPHGEEAGTGGLGWSGLGPQWAGREASMAGAE